MSSYGNAGFKTLLPVRRSIVFFDKQRAGFPLWEARTQSIDKGLPQRKIQIKSGDLCVGFGFFRAQAAKKQYFWSGLRPEISEKFQQTAVFFLLVDKAAALSTICVRASLFGKPARILYTDKAHALPYSLLPPRISS